MEIYISIIILAIILAVFENIGKDEQNFWLTFLGAIFVLPIMIAIIIEVAKVIIDFLGRAGAIQIILIIILIVIILYQHSAVKQYRSLMLETTQENDALKREKYKLKEEMDNDQKNKRFNRRRLSD